MSVPVQRIPDALNGLFGARGLVRRRSTCTEQEINPCPIRRRCPCSAQPMIALNGRVACSAQVALFGAGARCTEQEDVTVTTHGPVSLWCTQEICCIFTLCGTDRAGGSAHTAAAASSQARHRSAHESSHSVRSVRQIMVSRSDGSDGPSSAVFSRAFSYPGMSHLLGQCNLVDASPLSIVEASRQGNVVVNAWPTLVAWLLALRSWLLRFGW